MEAFAIEQYAKKTSMSCSNGRHLVRLDNLDTGWTPKNGRMMGMGGKQGERQGTARDATY